MELPRVVIDSYLDNSAESFLKAARNKARQKNNKTPFKIKFEKRQQKLSDRRRG